MCGLFGALNIGGLSVKDMSYTFNLGLMSQFRGRDSTGIAFIKKLKKNYGYGIEKDVVPSNIFLELPSTGKFVKDNCHPQAIIGHTRAATNGKINVENAHPFKFGNIVGAHNGRLSAFDNKLKDTSDSYNFFEELSKSNIKEAIKKARTAHDCAFAIVYFDYTDMSINMIRNDQRTLYRVDGDDKKTFFWASDKSFLEVCSRYSDLKLGSPCYMITNRLYKYRLTEPGWIYEDIPEDKVYGSAWDDNTKGFNHNHGYSEWWRNNNNKVIKPTAKKEPEKKTDQVILLQDKRPSKNWVSYKAYADEIWDVNKAASTLTRGCYGCRTQKTVQDVVYWRTRSSYLCEKCYADPLFIALETQGDRYQDNFFKSQVIVEVVRKKEA